MTDRDRARLAGVHPDLVAALGTRILPAMARAGSPVFVVEGVRTAERQAADFAKGRSAPGPDVSPERPLGRTVTNADGVHEKSRHQVQEDGYGHAVDLGFVGPDPFAEAHQWELLGFVTHDAGMAWGGDFVDPVTGRPMHDRPHVELPRRRS